MKWDKKNEKLNILQDKINSYLMFIESGQLLEEYPESNGKDVLIELFCKYLPNDEGLKFIDCIKPVIENAGFNFKWRLLNEKKLA